MNYKRHGVALTLIMMLSSPTFALDLRNEDDVTYTVGIVEGQGDASADAIELQAGEELISICESGCTIRLNNGVEDNFTGDETVTIKDGDFVVNG